MWLGLKSHWRQKGWQITVNGSGCQIHLSSIWWCVVIKVLLSWGLRIVIFSWRPEVSAQKTQQFLMSRLSVLLAWYANPSAKKYHVFNSNYSLQKRIKKTHYSKSLIFVQIFNFDQNFTLRHILEYFILLKRIKNWILVQILTQNWI